MSLKINKTVLDLSAGLRKLGIRRGGVLLVHSSLSSFGRLPGGAPTLIRALKKSLGPKGTLLMPALSYSHVGPKQTIFDARSTPSNVGIIPEAFRRQRGTLRSLHPTHSVCGQGPLARRILSRHHLDQSPCGPRSPFRMLRDLGGQILFVGCSLNANTSMHGVEELAPPPYLFGKLVAYSVTSRQGRKIRARSRAHDFEGVQQRYERLRPALRRARALKSGRLLKAQASLVEAAPMWELGLKALKENPWCFVKRVKA